MNTGHNGTPAEAPYIL